MFSTTGNCLFGDGDQDLCLFLLAFCHPVKVKNPRACVNAGACQQNLMAAPPTIYSLGAFDDQQIQLTENGEIPSSNTEMHRMIGHITKKYENCTFLLNKIRRFYNFHHKTTHSHLKHTHGLTKMQIMMVFTRPPNDCE